MASYNLVNIGSGNGLWPDGTKPLPKLMLIHHYLGYFGIHLGNVTGNAQDIYP